MATLRKSDPALVDAFHAALPLTGVERKPMFGCPSAFVHGNLFASVFETCLVVRIPSEAVQHPFAPMGRVMKEYAAIEDALDREPREIRELVERALAYARALPAKEGKKARAKKAVAKKVAARKG